MVNFTSYEIVCSCETPLGIKVESERDEQDILDIFPSLICQSCGDIVDARAIVESRQSERA